MARLQKTKLELSLSGGLEVRIALGEDEGSVFALSNLCYSFFIVRDLVVLRYFFDLLLALLARLTRAQQLDVFFILLLAFIDHHLTI